MICHRPLACEGKLIRFGRTLTSVLGELRLVCYNRSSGAMRRLSLLIRMA